jgi:uncharacterized membrane protein HdeD (DUF308 family)
MSYTQPQPMLSALAANWWTFFVRGIAAVLLGLVTLYPWPLRIDYVFVLLVSFGAYALVDGILALVASLRGSLGHMWPLLVEGVLGVLAGLTTFFWPPLEVILEVTNLNLYIIAAWAISTGTFEVAMAVSLRREKDSPFLMGFSGGLSILFGVLVAASASNGVDSYVFPLLGIYGLIFGLVLITLGVRVRGPRQGSGRVS